RYRWDTGLGLFVVMGRTDSTYDDAGRLTNRQHKDGLGNVLQNTTYTYDLADRITAQIVDGTTTSYSYDATNQLTADGANSYGYRNTTGYSTGAGNRTTADGMWTYTYDDEGNLTKKSKGASSETWTYGYDERNELVWAEQRATDGGTLQQRVEYAYDALGRRV